VSLSDYDHAKVGCVFGGGLFCFFYLWSFIVFTKRKLLGAACSLVLSGALAYCANATPSTSGGFVEFKAGCSSFWLKEFLRRKTGETASDQKAIVDVSGKGIYVGGGVGYTIECTSGLCLGVGLHVGSNFCKIEGADGAGVINKPFSVDANGTSVTVTGAYAVTEAKQLCNYGASVFGGAKVAANILVAVGVGFEAVYTKLSQYVDGGREFAIQNNAGLGHEVSGTIDGVIGKWKYTTNGTEEVKTTLYNFVPSVVGRYYVTKGAYVGAQVEVPIGISKKLDSKYSSKVCETQLTTANVTDQPDSIPSPDARSQAVYIKAPATVRVSVSVGVNF
jgi:hypothetical protein